MNKFLLDTHTLIWYFENSDELSHNVSNIIENTSNQVSISIISFWEIGIKINIGKLNLKSSLKTYFDEAKKQKFDILPISREAVLFYEKMPLHHRDPFDRLLIAEALTNDLTILGRDIQFDIYNVKRIW